VIDAVAEMDLSAFYAAYRGDGHGRAAHDPAMMVALLLYAYAVGCDRRGWSSGPASMMSRSV
jgi:transposase